MKLLIYSANLGSFERPQPDKEQILPEGIDLIETHRFIDFDFPPRKNAMTPRLQARLVKMFGWQMIEADYYLWVDASCRLPREDSAKWFMEQLGDGDMAVFKHPNRNTVQEEADYLRQRLIDEKEGRKQKYVLPRYENEDIDGALSEVDSKASLYASTAFIYRNTPEVQDALKEWWYLTSRYHSIDQLGFTEAIKDLNVHVIHEPYMECMYLEYTR